MNGNMNQIILVILITVGGILAPFVYIFLKIIWKWNIKMSKEEREQAWKEAEKRKRNEQYPI